MPGAFSLLPLPRSLHHFSLYGCVHPKFYPLPSYLGIVCCRIDIFEKNCPTSAHLLGISNNMKQPPGRSLLATSPSKLHLLNPPWWRWKSRIWSILTFFEAELILLVNLNMNVSFCLFIFCCKMLEFANSVLEFGRNGAHLVHSLWFYMSALESFPSTF